MGRNDGDWMPLHWAGLLGDKSPVADYNEIAVDHGGNDLASSSEELLSPAHYAAAAAHPNLGVLQAITLDNPRLFGQKGRGGALPLHYAVRYSDSAEVLEYILQQNPSATRAFAKLSYCDCSGTPLFHPLHPPPHLFVKSIPTRLCAHQPSTHPCCSAKAWAVRPASPLQSRIHEISRSRASRLLCRSAASTSARPTTPRYAS